MTQHKTRKGNGQGTIRHRGGRWEVRLRLEGETLYKSCESERKARDWVAAEITRARQRQQLEELGITEPAPPPPRPEITFADLAATLVLARTEKADPRRRKWSDGTKRWFLGHVNTSLAPAFGDQPVSAITSSRIAAWLTQQMGRPILHRHGALRGKPTGRVVSASTLKHYERALSMIFSFAVNPGRGLEPWLAVSPMQAVERTHVQRGARAAKRILRAREILALLQAALARQQETAAAVAARGPGKPRRLLELAAVDARRDLAYFTVIALTGMRKSEIARMRWSWVDDEDGMLWVRAAKIGTDLLSQEVPISPRALAALQELGPRATARLVFPGWKRSGQGGGARGTRKEEQPLTSMERPLRRLLDLAEIDGAGVSLHTFRHSFSSLLAKCGVQPHVIAQLMRHTAGTMTARYTHAEVEDQRQALLLLERAVFAPLATVVPINKPATAG